MKRLLTINVKRSLAANLLAAVVTASGLVSVAAKADFSGTWVMDKGRSAGVPPDMEQTMTVAQTADTLNVETKVVTDQGDQTVAGAYAFNGQETAYTPKRAGAEGRGRRTAKWAADGNGFEVTEEEKFDTPNGEVTFQFTRKWQMLPDGKTLTIELEVKGPNGPQHSKRTFVKK
jgi:uncharacterized Zn-binding protein involved in type VI secretion